MTVSRAMNKALIRGRVQVGIYFLGTAMTDFISKASQRQDGIIITRMLAINVSIPNLKIARLVQF